MKMKIRTMRDTLADRLCWSAYHRDVAISHQIRRLTYEIPGMTEDDADQIVRSQAFTRLDMAIIDLLYAIAAVIRPA